MAEQEQQQSKWRLHSGQYLGEISALCFLHLPSHFSSLPYLLAGTGSQLLLYNLEEVNIIESFQVFQGIRVHGITCESIDNSKGSSSSTLLASKVAIFGEKRVKLFNLHIARNASHMHVDLALVHSLPKFNHWLLDVSFVKENDCLGIGCGDNSVCIWDISSSSIILQVQSPEKCLLYSMRLWGYNLESLRIASGTIFNEVISIWKVVPHEGSLTLRSALGDDKRLNNSSSTQLHCQQYKAVHISRLVGHEGSIFRLAWSSDGSKLVSVSDDRSARIWAVEAEQNDPDNQVMETAGTILFGHTARVWDCCIFDSLIVTAGEDCTCRVWGLDGKQHRMIKEHIGRGVWRCLYDQNSSLLLTAGFDSAVKVHQLPASFPQSLDGRSEREEFIDRIQIFTSRIPNSYEPTGFMDSKSEYVRCLHFTCKDTLYIATNHGYLYHAKLFQTQEVKWTKLVQVSEKVPIVCMDLLSKNLPRHSYGVDDWVALGDGKGNLTIVRVAGVVCTLDNNFTITWSAEKERQLLGTYWCKALGNRFIFTADPRGVLKIWKLPDPLLPVPHISARMFDVSLVAEFSSCFGNRIMCLDASSSNEVLVCGDLRGNLVLYPLTKGLLLDSPAGTVTKISPLSYFKGAHGISSVSSISVSTLSSSETEICSTGADGCICYFEYDQDQKSLEFIGMKQVKELSLIQSVSANNNSLYDSANSGYAIGFASTDFIIWNLTTEAKVLQIPCGGWRRPHSYYLGDIPEMDTCFAYVKDEIIYIHRQWILESERKIFPHHMHVQFHGRELHTLCFISNNDANEENGKDSLFDKSSWIATGCEDGTVRLTRYNPGVESWTTSKLLGEHVGGSAVRSICFVSKMHFIPSDMTNMSDWRYKLNAFEENCGNPLLLISVGAKRVLTSWLLRDKRLDKKGDPLVKQEDKNGNGYMPCMGISSSMSFKWLSTDMPAKISSAHRKTKNRRKIGGNTKNVASMEPDTKFRSLIQEKGETESKGCLDDNDEDDWRYLAVTAFHVKCTGSKLTVCFIVVACSDATLALRALVLPHRLWFDVALLVPLSSPVLALQHVIIPAHLLSGETTYIGNAYIVISGATDGSIAFWDLTESIESFLRQLSTLDTEKLIHCQTRPRTGRGSQGGRRWKSLKSNISKKKPADSLVSSKAGKKTSYNLVNDASDAESCRTDCAQAMHNVSLEPEVNSVDPMREICEIHPLHVLCNVHQSGVNCLHVSDIQDSRNSDSGFLFCVISGGDDQALHCLKFNKSLLSTHEDSEIVTPDTVNIIAKSESSKNSILVTECQIKKYGIRLSYHDRVTSAHSSAIKGVWTDGTWVFSTGLDQRVRCWLLKEHRKLTEQTHLIISVPEPETLHARACERNRYEIAVAGRGMQMIEFLAS
ncbi:nucleotide binding protein, putative [Ricinus communis]|uniref:Nucleotide binding protein, putative n=1 Tax=Ricinus communis TaxID=3988 RepID=B9RN68_RICCO|nr:nucleotide binding protein, putative [Ricinus communis]